MNRNNNNMSPDRAGNVKEKTGQTGERGNQEIIPENCSCEVDDMIDESYRIDDNSNMSTTAEAGIGKCMNDSLVPGVGVEEAGL